MKVPPSILNDVLGPVMRGPSSSHSAAANRIGRIGRALAQGEIAKLVVRYDPNGSLVTTCLLYTSPSPRDQRGSRMPSSA